MATTAAGVAVGSTIGHTLGAGLTGMFGGGSSNTQQVAPPVEQQPKCESDQKAFMKCLESNSNDISACQFYLDMLKQCQSDSNF
jgi:hypothetical protein